MLSIVQEHVYISSDKPNIQNVIHLVQEVNIHINHMKLFRYTKQE